MEIFNHKYFKPVLYLLLGLYLFFSYFDKSNLYRFVAFFGLFMAIYYIIAILNLVFGKEKIKEFLFKIILPKIKRFIYETILPIFIISLIIVTLGTGVKESFKIIDENFIGYNYWLYGLLIALIILIIRIIIKRKLSFSTSILAVIFIPIYFIFGISFINNRFYTAPHQESFIILEKINDKTKDDDTDTNIYKVSIRKDKRIIDVMIPKKIWLKKKKKDSIKLELANGYFGYEFVLKTIE